MKARTERARKKRIANENDFLSFLLMKITHTHIVETLSGSEFVVRGLWWISIIEEKTIKSYCFILFRLDLKIICLFAIPPSFSTLKYRANRHDERKTQDNDLRDETNEDAQKQHGDEDDNDSFYDGCSSNETIVHSI